jgi:hypothetical protein
VNGLPPVWTGWALDGANITESQLGGTAIQPNVDALQEFRVEGANMSAEYGHTPTIVNATLEEWNQSIPWRCLLVHPQQRLRRAILPPPGVNQPNEPLHRGQSVGTFVAPSNATRHSSSSISKTPSLAKPRISTTSSQARRNAGELRRFQDH